MPPRRNTLAAAEHHAAWLRREAGRELRAARLAAGVPMRALAVRLGWSRSKISRIELARSPAVTVEDLSRLGALLGVRLAVRFYPDGAVRVRDAGQVELLATLNARMHARWSSRQEVPMPLAGDRRAADQLSVIPGCRLMVEAYRRLADFQAQLRAARLKQRDLGADRLLILLEDTRLNRLALRSLGGEDGRSLPVPPRRMLAALAAGVDPGADGVLLLRRRARGGVTSPAPPSPPAPSPVSHPVRPR